MRFITKKVVLSLILILALLAASIAGCQQITETDTTGAPTIPPKTTFVMNFDDFNAGGASTASADTAALVQPAGFTFGDDDLYPLGLYTAVSQTNWNWAALNVGVWSFLIIVGSAVPVATFVASFNYTPQQLEDYTWEWYYNVPVGMNIYSAKLHGKFIDNYPSASSGTDAGVRWEMYVSKQGEFTDFLWYYGESNLPATEGFWILKDNATDQTDLIRINWTRNLTEDIYSIKYTNIVPDGTENGGYIYFEATTDVPYDRYYDIYNRSGDNHTEIEWSSITQEGRVKDYLHFGSDEWYYWDSEHQNTSGGSS